MPFSKLAFSVSCKLSILLVLPASNSPKFPTYSTYSISGPVSYLQGDPRLSHNYPLSWLSICQVSQDEEISTAPMALKLQILSVYLYLVSIQQCVK
jgi:hypothetical protein